MSSTSSVSVTDNRTALQRTLFNITTPSVLSGVPSVSSQDFAERFSKFATNSFSDEEDHFLSEWYSDSDSESELAYHDGTKQNGSASLLLGSSFYSQSGIGDVEREDDDDDGSSVCGFPSLFLQDKSKQGTAAENNFSEIQAWILESWVQFRNEWSSVRTDASLRNSPGEADISRQVSIPSTPFYSAKLPSVASSAFEENPEQFATPLSEFEYPAKSQEFSFQYLEVFKAAPIVAVPTPEPSFASPTKCYYEDICCSESTFAREFAPRDDEETSGAMLVSFEYERREFGTVTTLPPLSYGPISHPAPLVICSQDCESPLPSFAERPLLLWESGMHRVRPCGPHCELAEHFVEESGESPFVVFSSHDAPESPFAPMTWNEWCSELAQQQSPLSCMQPSIPWPETPFQPIGNRWLSPAPFANSALARRRQAKK